MNTTNNEWEERFRNKFLKGDDLDLTLNVSHGTLAYITDLVDFIRSERSSVRRETVESVRKSILEQFDMESVPNHKIYFNLEELLTNLDTISHEETH